MTINSPRAWFPVLVLLNLLLRTADALGLECDESFVSLRGQVVHIDPTGIDDSENLRCALTQATESRVPEVRLSAGTFYLGSAVEISGFSGMLTGMGRDRTRIELVTGMADCSESENPRNYVAAVKFRGGQPYLRWFSIATQSHPCSGGELDALLQLTGHPGSPGSCGDTVIHATVERVSMTGQFIPDPANGLPVRAGPESLLLVAPERGDESCQTLLLGTLTLLRNDFLLRGSSGAGVAMGGAATVLVNGNSFKGWGVGLFIEAGAQTATISYNSFELNSSEWASTGLVCLAEQPGATSCVIRNNEFFMQGSTWGNTAIALVGGDASNPVNVPSGATIADNDFYVRGDWGNGAIRGNYVNGVVVRGNRFSAEPDVPTNQLHSGITIDVREGSDWIIAGNRGFSSLERWDDSIDIELANTNRATLRDNDSPVIRDGGQDTVIIED